MYTPHIFVTVDIVLIRKKSDSTELLLIKRKNEPFKNHWALPGGFVDKNEDIFDAALRELYEETDVKINHLEQIGAYGNPNRDPRHHTLSVAYFAEIDCDIIATAKDDALDLQWFCIEKLPNMAFDHKEIVDDAFKRFL